ncbi:uncharacterized protein [Channa argus]|uniref:uncharacterized protein n=1 Tax=Channa argus TaxID=215402 RepID=UPI00352076CC
MKTKEHSEEVRENVIEKHKSGDGYKKISKSSNIPLSTVKAIIKKWKEYGKSLNLLRTGCPQKRRESARRELVSVAKNYTVKTREHSKKLCENFIENHNLGDGHKKYSKPVNIPLSTVTSIIKKWKVYGTSINLSRAGHPPKLSESPGRELLTVAKNYTVKTKEHSKEVRENVIEKHKSGDGYKKISKSLNIPLSTVKSIIKKWKEHGTSVNLHRSGHPQKLSESAKRELVSIAKNCTRKTKEHPTEVREKVIEKHRSGDGYKKISKSLNIPLSTVKSIIKKWKEHGTSVNLHRSGRPQKLSESAKRELVNITKNCTRKTKEHPTEVRDNVIEKHKLGDGYKKISRSLNIPLSTVKSIIKKWKEYGTSVNLRRAGRPKKLSDCATRAILLSFSLWPQITNISCNK